ncbi:MAG: hypothetical protein LBU34_08625 [Planctomycetaceae bacterium]|jgi:hypothetical protein|nr:hypothetical protein [Planctomycetaceae bacterium]
MYKDEIISFILPSRFTKVKRDLWFVWILSGRKTEECIIFCFIDERRFFPIQRLKDLTKIDANFRLRQIQIQDSVVFYVENTGISDITLFTSEIEIVIENPKFTLNIKIPSDSLWDISEYMPFLQSITINFEKAQQAQQQLRDKIKKQKIKYPEPYFLIPFTIPPNFSREKTDPISGRVLLTKSGMQIQIFDLTDLGYEADIDIFKESLKKDEKIEDTSLWKLRGKRCLVQNLEGTLLDFSSCKNISILLAFRGKCYSVLMKSDDPFDLNEYKTFLDSIGVKTKNHQKTIKE